MDATSNVIQLDRVRCLDCGTKYVKPAVGGTVHENPGCPKCGYVGWVAVTVPPSPRGLRRFSGDPPRHRVGQSR